MLKGLVHLAHLLIPLAQEEMVIGLSLRTRGQVIRTGRILGPQEGFGGETGGGSPRKKEEIKKNPSGEGHKKILRLRKILGNHFHFTFEEGGCQMGNAKTVATHENIGLIAVFIPGLTFG
jgi:hypothetical protein